MSVFLSWLFAVYFFTTSFILVGIAALLCLVTTPFDPNRRILHYFACWWGFHYVQLNPFWKCTFEGRENIDPTKTYILVANHQSFADILILYGLSKPFKWVSKEEIFKVPCIGWNMYLNQYVKIKRGNISSIKEMMATCQNWLTRGASILMFPEGTRSKDGELQHFRDGSFRLACDNNLPVVPIVVTGTREILPKGKMVLTFESDIRVKVLPPVSPQDFVGQPTAMRDYVYKLMQATLSELRSHKIPALNSR